MDAAYDALDFEKAAELRDKIRALSDTASRGKSGGATGDYFALDMTGSPAIAIARIRDGRYLSHQIIYPKQTEGMTPTEIMEQTILWFYGNETRNSILDTRIQIITNIETPLLNSNFEYRVSKYHQPVPIQHAF